MSANTVCLCGGEFKTQTMLVQHAQDQGHFIRCSCRRLFATLQHLQHHERDAHPLQTGSFEVLALFESLSSVPTYTHTCDICHSTLANEHGLAMHIQARHPTCPTCQQRFASSGQLEGHQQATSHCYCAEHALTFGSNEQLRRHIRASVHVTGFECTSCYRAFRSNRALLDHLSSDGHASVERAIQARAIAVERASSNALRGLVTPDEAADLRCDDCNRTFRRFDALLQHKKSVKHNPLSDLRCPMSEECTQVFTSPSALLFHLEGGNCKSGMNRAKVDMLVHQHDADRQITTLTNYFEVAAAAAAATTASLGSGVALASRLGALSIDHGSSAFGRLTDVSDADSTTSDNNNNGVPVFTPTTSHRSYPHSNSPTGDATLTQSSRAGSEWSFINTANDRRARAPSTGLESSSHYTTLSAATTIQQTRLCPVPGCEKSFKQQHSLIEHLNSPVHARELYHCPTGLTLSASRHSAKSFKTMSGILQHLEAGACVGGRAALDQIFALLEIKIAQVTGSSVRLLCDGDGAR